MREPIRDIGRLEHIVSTIENIEEYSVDITEEMLYHDKLRTHAIIYNLQIVGEAVYKLTNEFKNSHQNTPWDVIEKMRHILVHDYYRVNFEVLWDVIIHDLPSLKQEVREYLSEANACNL